MTGKSEKPARSAVPAEALRRFVAGVFVRAGMPGPDAATVADALVWANLRGVDSHGVARVPRYVEWIEAGIVNARPDLRVRTETLASVLIEADRAAGPVAMTAAMDAAASKAREAGVGLALVRATTHTAALGYFTSRAAESGLAAIAMAASIPSMAVHGAAAAGVSTSPISIAVPGSDGPLVLDMGTGIVSLGALAQARRAGQRLPAGSALDANGRPTTDPLQAEIPLPMGGPKGSGLALMIECVTSLIVSNAILADTAGKPAQGRRHRQNALALAIDVARFGDPAAFRREVERLVQAIKALPRADAAAEILVPGERGARVQASRSRDGIPVPASVREELRALAARLGAAAFPVES